MTVMTVVGGSLSSLEYGARGSSSTRYNVNATLNSTKQAKFNVAVVSDKIVSRAETTILSLKSVAASHGSWRRLLVYNHSCLYGLP